MNTYFARHTADIDIDSDTREKLWQEQWVAIHYPEDRNGTYPEQAGNIHGGKENVSFDPADYTKRASGPVSRLRDLATHGGYVCAEYAGKSECVLGYVSPGANLELLHGKRGSLRGAEGRPAVMKGIRLQKTKLVSTRRYAQIFVGRPQQGTLSKWHCVGALIENLVEGKPHPTGVETLFPHQLEVLCSEFLRTEAASQLGLPRLQSLLLPVGRTLKGIDILGIDMDGTPIYAQVTHPILANDKKKFADFLRYQDVPNARLIYFCSNVGITQNGLVQICSTELVYRTFTSSPEGQRWLDIATNQALLTGEPLTYRSD